MQHDAQLQDKAAHFDERQAEIDTKLKNFTQSETSDEAVHSFESLMNKLQRLDIANGYLDLVKEVDELRYVSTGIVLAGNG